MAAVGIKDPDAMFQLLVAAKVTAKCRTLEQLLAVRPRFEDTVRRVCATCGVQSSKIDELIEYYQRYRFGEITTDGPVASRVQNKFTDIGLDQLVDRVAANIPGAEVDTLGRVLRCICSTNNPVERAILELVGTTHHPVPSTSRSSSTLVMSMSPLHIGTPSQLTILHLSRRSWRPIASSLPPWATFSHTCSAGRQLDGPSPTGLRGT
jgi:hypothetical protein